MLPNSIFPQSDDRLFTYFLKESLTGLISPDSRTKNGHQRDDIILFVILGLILITGTEPLKVVLRRNIGKLSLSIPRLVTACVLYLIYATVLIWLAYDKNLQQFSIAFIAGGIFYILFAFNAIFNGLNIYSAAKQKYFESPYDYSTHIYRGDSIYFKGKDQRHTWLITEPKFCFLISFLLTAIPAFYQPVLLLLGAPLFMTSISFWFNEWYQVNNVWNSQANKIEKEKMKASQTQSGFQNEEFNIVN